MAIFKTKAGREIYKSRTTAIFSSTRAVVKAAQLGVDSLIVEEEGRVLDYSYMLTRYYDKKQSTLNPAA